MEGEEVGHLEDLHASVEIFFIFTHPKNIWPTSWPGEKKLSLTHHRSNNKKNKCLLSSRRKNAHLIVIFDPSNEIIDVWCPQTEITALFHFSLKDCSTAISHVFFQMYFRFLLNFWFLTTQEIKVHIFLKKGANRASARILISLRQTLYANEVYELMHDPIRIITAPVGSEAGAISEVVP